ncbi:hypothetical protein SH467x_002581 [Pirellulaceae bacterium SH467]
MRILSSIICALVVLGAFGTRPSEAQPPRIALDAISPHAAVAGGAIEFRVIGRNTQDVDRLVFNHPGIRAELKKGGPLPGDDEPQSEFGVFQVSIGADVPPGIVEVHAVGKYGVSNPRLFAVVPASSPVIQIPSAGVVEPLPPGGWMAGRARRQERIQIPIETGREPTYLVCITTGLDSMMLPRLVVRNERGVAVQSMRWQDRLPIVKAIPSGFRGTVEISDDLYRGGESFPFLIGLSPTPGTPFHASPFLAPASSVGIQSLPTWPILDRRSLDAVAHDVPYTLTPPCEVLLDRSRDTSFQWEQTAGTTLEAEVLSHSLGQSTDVRLTVSLSELEQKEAPKFSQVGEDSPAVGSKGISLLSYDPRVAISIPGESAPKRVTLSLSDQQSRSMISSPGTHPLRLRVGPPAPRFYGVAHWSPWTNNPAIAGLTGSLLPRGGQVALHIAIVRSGGFAGEVEVAPRVLPDGIACLPARIAPGQNEGFLLLSGSEQLGDSVAPLELIAKGKIGDTVVESPVPIATIFQSATAERGQPLSRIASGLWLRTSSELAPITIQSKTTDELTVAAGDKIAIPLVAARRAGGEAKCILRGQYVPPKCTLPDIELAANGQEVAPELTTAKDTPPGEYVLCFQGEMTWKMSVHPESHARYVAYRDRLVSKKEKATTDAEKGAVDQAIAAANMRIEQLAKEIAPRDFPTFFYTAPVRIRILPPKE